MKPRLLDLLVCPIDRQPLELLILRDSVRPLNALQLERSAALGIAPESLERDIEDGLLINRRLGVAYPILRGVPRMLTFTSPVHDAFDAAHPSERRIRSVAWPTLPPPPGERDVLRSFSTEWVEYDWDGQTYWNQDAEAWFKSMRFILGLEEHPVRRQTILEVGIGVGGTAHHLAENEECEVVGLDLGFAVDAAYSHFGSNPFLHVVQASVFAPPFREAQFDMVYSFGVIHHTYSTKAAFDQISRLPRGGGRLYIWVYSNFDEQRTIVRRGLMTLENLTRPVLARLPNALQTAALVPFVPLYMAHQAVRRALVEDQQVFYGPREAIHAARDRFTPRYIHRHDEDEVVSWFSQAGYGDVGRGSTRGRPSYVPEAFTACTSVCGIRRF